MTLQPQNNNLSYLIDPTLTNFNRLFVLSFARNNNTVITGNLLDFAYLKKIINKFDLSKQTKLKDPQQINFIGKLLKNTGATTFFIIEKSEETTFNFSQNFVTII